MQALAERRFTFADLATVCVLLVAPVLRLALLTGPAGSDDLNYFHFAGQLARFEHFTQLHHHAGRLMFLVVVGVPAALFGSIASGCVVNVLLLSLRDLLVVWFVRRETDPAAGAVAAAIVSLNAISTAYAGLMIPDPLLSLLMFASAVALYEGVKHADAGARGRLVALAGLLAAMSYSAKDPGILMTAPSMLLIVAALRRPWRERARLAVLYAGGLVAVAALESLAYWFISGDFLYRSHALAKVHNAAIVEAPNALEFLRATYWNLRLVTTVEAASTQVLIGGAVVFVAALATRSKLAYFSATGLFVATYLIFGSSSFTRFMPLPVQDRYFEPLVAFVAVGGAALVHRFHASGPGALRAAAVGIALMVVTAVPPVTANAGDVAFSGVGRNAGVAIRAAHAARPDLPIVVSPMLERMIEPFVSPELFAVLRPMPDEALVDGFYLSHPWEPDSSAPLLAKSHGLPVYLVVDEDQRWLGRYALEPRATDRGATVRVRE